LEKIGQVNRYICRHPTCGKHTVTINLNSGTTPFGIKCPKCGHPDSFSQFYRVGSSAAPGGTIAVTVAECFYRPTREAYDKLDHDHKAFVYGGAMLHAPLGTVTPLPEPEPPFSDLQTWLEFARKTYGPNPERK
jgi:hypothetical protein